MLQQTLQQEAAGPPEEASQDQPALIPSADLRPRSGLIGLILFSIEPSQFLIKKKESKMDTS